MTIGEHGSPWTAETARGEAERLLGNVAHGADPGGERAAARRILTVAEFAKEFIEQYAEVHRAASSAAEYGRLLRRNGILSKRDGTAEGRHADAGAADTSSRRTPPAVRMERIAGVRLDRVQRGEIIALHTKRGETPFEANRLLAVLSRMFSLAEQKGLRPTGSNPCRGVERYREARRERFLSAAELARLGNALAEATRRHASAAKPCQQLACYADAHDG